MNSFPYAVKPVHEISKAFSVDPGRGLDDKSIAAGLAKYGMNKLAIKETSGWHIFLRQFKSAFVYLLLAAMGITAFMGQMVDTAMIFLFLAINTGLGFYQEYSSEKTAQLLNKYALPRAKVLRSGIMAQITADQLVPGDIIGLETGDKVPADIRLIEADNLMVDETVLTGESLPVIKHAADLHDMPVSYHEAYNLAFSGTDVLKGEAKGLVVATGRQTAFGQIARLAGETRKISDFEKGISQFSKFILKLIGITLFIMFFAHLLIRQDGIDLFELIVFSVALTISVIPEALPLVTTFSLARAAKRLAKHHVIVKRLSAIEDLGGIEMLCCDKTGTLTENKLQLVDTYSVDQEDPVWLANLASAFELKEKIEPFDIALEAGLKEDQKVKISNAHKLHEHSFDPKTRRNTVMVSVGDQTLLIIRGAAESILQSSKEMVSSKAAPIGDWIRREGLAGHRVLAVGYKKLGINSEGAIDFNEELNKADFTFSGIISFSDPVKKSSYSAVTRAKALGVKIVIITGDSPEVAGAVAHEIGLIDLPDKVITGARWASAEVSLQNEWLEKEVVFARVAPDIKFAMIERLRQKNMIGFLGEGINDAPALKIAGVSLVVDSAADIAREASDIILLTQNLDVIIDGIQEGRQVFANTTKYIKSTLASNFGNFFAVATASLLIDFLPMLPIQILLLNLLSDTPMISIATDNVDPDELQSPRKYQAKDIIIIALILGVVSTVFDFIFFAMYYQSGPAVLQTNWFIGSILTELVLLFSIRSRSVFFKASRPSNPILIISVLTVLATLALPYSYFGQTYFKFVAPLPEHLIVILGVVVAYFILTEITKLLYYRSNFGNHLSATNENNTSTK